MHGELRNDRKNHSQIERPHPTRFAGHTPGPAGPLFTKIGPLDRSPDVQSPPRSGEGLWRVRGVIAQMPVFAEYHRLNALIRPAARPTFPPLSTGEGFWTSFLQDKVTVIAAHLFVQSSRGIQQSLPPSMGEGAERSEADEGIPPPVTDEGVPLFLQCTALLAQTDENCTNARICKKIVR